MKNKTKISSRFSKPTFSVEQFQGKDIEYIIAASKDVGILIWKKTKGRSKTKKKNGTKIRKI